MSQKDSVYGYEYVFFSGKTFTVAEFTKQFDQLNIWGVTHLSHENVSDGDDFYTHNLKGALKTSMGTIEVFNYSDKS